MKPEVGSTIWIFNNVLDEESKNAGAVSVEVLAVDDLTVEVKHYKTKTTFKLLLEDFNDTWFITNPEKWKSNAR